METSFKQPTITEQRGNLPKITFDKKEVADFYPEVRKRVDAYFKSKNIGKHANGAMIAKTVFILTVFIGSYVLLLSNIFSPGVLLLLAIVNGFFTALIGLNIAHDAIHGAFSSNSIVNKAMGLWFNIVGANDYMWMITHNVVHHTYTNIPDHDEDIDQIPIIRLNPNQDLWPIHRFQYIYVFLFYPLASLSWVFLKDYKKFFKSHIGSYDNSQHPRKEFYRLFFFKAVYYFLFLVLPFTLIELPWYYILVGFLALHFVEGLTLALVFQLAHTVEGTSFPAPDENGKIANSWAAHQMYTTANFARKNPVANFLFGGLNFQVEHHLFPRICHIHYRHIAPIVKQTAEEFHLPYIENETFIGAIGSHIRTLKKFGRGEVQPA
ncbi:MAG: acyl-CoA desaturase [Lewinellaceae bacterium]|nr:acyl-CoA desaturase [Phaeodactylibacter sp.]MCB0614832.1 acyl-CoA desaturase [Phaeodactylibacter sp.]MCB9345996.1 acyl-CoA desaturase [Lewinellaceae bacterium]